MLKKLSLNLQERLKNRFRDHPLMQTCQKVFLHYMASMEQFDFTAEDLFVEVSEVIDSILGNPQGARQYLENLWDTLKIKLKRKAPTPPPQADLEMVCGVLYYVVAAIFCLHWREFYNTELVNMLRDTVERKRLFSDDEEEIISNLCHHADALDDWINHYDDSDKWLSDEIEMVLNPEANGKPDERRQQEVIPKELLTKDAQLLWGKLRDAGFIVVDGYSLADGISANQATYIAECMATKLGIMKKWKVFQQLWGINNMAQLAGTWKQTGKEPPRAKEIRELIE